MIDVTNGLTHSRQIFIKKLFRSGEQICTGNLYTTGLAYEYEFEEFQGPFISINPLQTKRADANVVEFRNFLIEMDGGQSFDDQLEIVRKVGLPYATCAWSGGKSLHFVVCLDKGTDEPTWRKLARALVRAVPGADPATTNPSRFTRLPGAKRYDKEGHPTQTLLDIGEYVTIEQLNEFCKPHIEEQAPNFRKLYSALLGVEGLEAAHPLTHDFIAGKHPCFSGRNNALFASAADLRDVGIEFDEAIDKLLPAAIGLGLSEREAMTTLRSAYSRSSRR